MDGLCSIPVILEHFLCFGNELHITEHNHIFCGKGHLSAHSTGRLIKVITASASMKNNVKERRRPPSSTGQGGPPRRMTQRREQLLDITQAYRFQFV